MKKNITISPKYYIFLDLLNFCRKDLGRVALLRRKGVMSLNTLIHRENKKKNHYHQKKHFQQARK